MKLTTFAQTLHDLSLIKDLGLDEVILGHKEFSRFGLLTDETFESLVKRSKELGLKVIFEWDILMTESVFEACSKKITPLLKDVDVMRVQDPGALEWSLQNTHLPLQFIAENGNHNLRALKTWGEYIGARLDRIILSIELTKASLQEYISELKFPLEILGFGRILLFYTPRSLLSPVRGDKLSYHDQIVAIGESEESPHKGFPLVENRHGTFMFHIKEFCLLEFAEELSDFGLSTFRIDLRWQGLEYLKEVKSIVFNFEDSLFQQFKEHYPQDLMKGFYLVNKTDVLFPKLKNARLQKREGDYIGEVMEAEKGSYLAILVKHKRGIKKSDRLRIIHPKGDEFEVDIYSLKNIDQEMVEMVSFENLALIQFVGGVWVKSQVFLV